MSTPFGPTVLAAGKAPSVYGLDDHTQGLVDELWRVWVGTQPRNALRESYLDGKNRLKNLDISIPQHLAEILDVVVGWPETAVYSLAQRCVFEGLVAPGGGADPLGLSGILRANRFEVELAQAIVSSVAHSVSFIETARGREAGEPDVLVMMHSAVWSAGLWSRTKRAMRGFMAINDTDELGRPTLFTVSTPFETLVCRKGAGGAWFLDDRQSHPLGRVPVEALPFRPTMTRPFGRARINRPVMSLTDRAVRNAARMELGAELHAAPKYILLGADEDIFRDKDGNPAPLWSWYLSRMNSISRDEEGEVPQIEKIAAESPEVYISGHRQLAAQFSGETGVPLGSLGISTDNPTSAQAINEVREDLIINAQDAMRIFDLSVQRTAENVVMMRDGLSEVPEEAAAVRGRWRNPRNPSVVSQSDAMVKQISAIPWLAESTVALEELGYTDEQITRLLADKRRAEGGSMLERIERMRSERAISATVTADADEA